MRFLAFFLAAIGAAAQALAGSYSQNFNAVAVGVTTLGDGSTISASAGSITTSVQQVTAGNNGLQMMVTGFGGNSAAYKLADLDPTKPIQSFDATFKVKMNNSGAGSVPGAGWSLNFGAIPGGNGAGEGGFVMTGGLTIAWDIYNNGGSDAPSVEVFAGGVSVGNSPRTFTYDETLRTVAIHWDFNGLDVTYDGVAIFTDLPVPGFAPLSGNKFAFSVRNEPSNTMAMWLDDVVMATTIEQPVETGGPVISEFMADNNSTLEDEDTDSSDWIEIYNGQNATVNLSGWRLTNVKEKLKIGKDRVNIAKLNLLTTQSPAVTGGYIFRKDKADPDNPGVTPVTNSMAALPPAQENAVMRHYRLFPRLGQYDWPNAPGYASRTTFQSEVSYMKTWLTTRLAWLDEQNFTGSVIYRPPTFSAYGGNVSAGAQVTIAPYAGTPPTNFTYATGTIYYTTNGADPRGPSGAPAGSVYGGALTLNTSQVVKARLYNGGNWSPITSGTFVVNAAPASAANLVVSEIMYDPPVATAAEITAGYSTNDFEYIELLNVGATAVDLTNVAFTNGVLFNFGMSNPTLLTVPVGGRVVVAGDANAFVLRYGNNPAVKVTGPFSGNLANGGELVTLVDAGAVVIANFTFANSEPWPVDAHGGTGYSLVLNNPAPSLGSAYYNDGVNWRSSGTLNGTPGLANSTAFAGSPTGDTDGDGIKDFFEYATGSNMNSVTSRNLPVTSIAPFTVGAVTQNYLKLDCRRNLAADGVHYTVQYCTDLSTWVSDAAAVTYVGTHNNGDGTATVTYRTTQPVDAAHPRMFLRLSVSP